MTKKQRYNICASAYLELRRVDRLSSRRSPVRELGKRILGFDESAPFLLLIFALARAGLPSSRCGRFPGPSDGRPVSKRTTDATYAKKADGRTWQCQPSQILHLKVVVVVYQ